VVSRKDMVMFYIAVIRPAIEYAARVRHTGLTAESAETLKSVQIRALTTISGGSSFTNSSYLSFCESLAVSFLQSGSETLSINFFLKISEPSCCLYCPIPTKRSNSQLKTTELLVILPAIHTYQKVKFVVSCTRVA